MLKTTQSHSDALNQDPENTGEPNGGHCERRFYVQQDTNYNVVGVTGTAGNMVERYEYTPYGERTIFSHGYKFGDFNNEGKVDGSDLALWQQNYDPVGSGDIAAGSGDESAPVGGLALGPIADEASEAVIIAVSKADSTEAVTPSAALGVSAIRDDVEAVKQSAIATTRPHGGNRLAWSEDNLVDILTLPELDVQ